MQINVIRYPSEEDWARAYWLALGTEGKQRNKVPAESWRKSLLRSGHSPARTLMYTVEIADIPYWVVMHLVRHKVGIEHYVSTQRNDRQSDYDRAAARQDSPVLYRFEANAQTLIEISHKRLCGKAAAETRAAWREVCKAVEAVTPEIHGLLVPTCVHQGGRCDEFRPCNMREVILCQMDLLR